MTSMAHFLHMYRHHKLNDNTTWRAYDIFSSVRVIHTRAALKALGLSYAGELALSQFMALYEVPKKDEARRLLGAWWLLSQIEKGRLMRVARRGPGAEAATTLAGEWP